jgi:hypothetical protein
MRRIKSRQVRIGPGITEIIDGDDLELVSPPAFL